MPGPEVSEFAGIATELGGAPATRPGSRLERPVASLTDDPVKLGVEKGNLFVGRVQVHRRIWAARERNIATRIAKLGHRQCVERASDHQSRSSTTDG